MPPVNWNVFANLPGSATSNFEALCRALMRRHYGQYGDFVALAAQPGVEFHLRLRTSCSLGVVGKWYGWQCRWYGLPSGAPLGGARRSKILKAIRTSEKVLPHLTDWVLWTRHALSKQDQDWFYSLQTRMTLRLWTALEVEEHLSGEAAILRGTYFGELVLTPSILATLHQQSVAPIRSRWQPEAHQSVDAERALRQILAETASWDHLVTLATKLKCDVEGINSHPVDSSVDAVKELTALALSVNAALSQAHAALISGDLDILRPQLMNCPDPPSLRVRTLSRQLRALQHDAALFATNAIADVRAALGLLSRLNESLEKRMIAVLAEAGCGKTQLGAQLTSAVRNRPAGIFILGRELHGTSSLDDLACGVTISGTPIASMEALVAAVDAAGQRAHRRLPIVIDGLNEAEDPRRWASLLASLNQILLGYPYVLVVCTVRNAFADESLPVEIERLDIPGFGHDTIQAIIKYFHYYRIVPDDAELPFELLSHPLTLRLFCDVTNPTRKNMVGVEAMPGSLTELLDKYLEQAAERVAQLAPRTRRYYAPEVREAFDKIGDALWKERVRTLDFKTLRQRLGDSDRAWNESIVRALEQEGVLLRYPGERVTGLYDAMSGHLIAKAILNEYATVAFQAWLKEPANAAALGGPLAEQHPLANDVFRALVGLLPRLHRQQLWSLLEPPLRTIALGYAANLEGPYLDAATIAELGKLTLTKPHDSRDLFHRLRETRGAATHPLNSHFLDAVLRALPVADRDLRWTEWIRQNGKDLLADLQYLERRWRRMVKRSVSEQLRARWVMWLLTSTIRELRDQATRALYWYGQVDPPGLFRLTVQALGTNDPYIPERMLAATYGVCMALHDRPKRRLFRTKMLPKLARSIYKTMFAPASPNSTTHVLSRDFARHIIDIAVLHSPALLSTEQRARTVPPFTEGAIREWQEMNDPGEDKYRKGNSPLGIDFANYTLGRLVPERRNYDFEDKEYRRVVRQIVWRIYQLGYALEKFGEIDKEIARSGLYFGRSERPLTERYGKKYARIAYLELYGLRRDQGLLESSWRAEEFRTSEIDIDPSFPGGPRGLGLIPDFLGDRTGDIHTWVKEGPSPDFRQYLTQERFEKATGPWILLDGHCRQQDKAAERTGFVRLQAFIMLKEDTDQFLRLMKKEPPRGKWLPDALEDHFTFAGEIPWCDTFPNDVIWTIDFVVGKVKKKVSRDDPRYNLRFILDLGGEEKIIGPREPPEFEEINVYKRIPVYVPVRESRFSSEGGSGRPNCTVPGKYMGERFRLWLDLPSWNMRDASGSLCSVAIGKGKLSDYEQHIFFRKDLIDELLRSEHLGLVWVVWGERQHFGERHVGSPNADHFNYRYFNQIYRYAGGQPRRVV